MILALMADLMVGCQGSRSSTASYRSADYAPAVVVGTIENNEVRESSGLAISTCQPNVLWTHNDAGSDAFIYALTEDGKHLGTWRVAGAQNIDWEDIAAYRDADGTCFLYIGDIGDNEKERGELTIYRVPEPAVVPESSRSNIAKPLSTEVAQASQFRYPDQRNNAESLLVHPRKGDIYVVTKEKKRPAAVYKVVPAFGSTSVANAEKIAEISVPADPVGLLTGGSISPDGMRVILCDVQNGYEMILPPGTSNFDEIWKQPLLKVDLGARRQGEGVTYNADGSGIYASSEKKNAKLFAVKRQ